MTIPRPRHEATLEDYPLDCQEALDLPVADLVDEAIQSGWDPRQVYKAIAEVARMQAIAYEEDPDRTAN